MKKQIKKSGVVKSSGKKKNKKTDQKINDKELELLSGGEPSEHEPFLPGTYGIFGY